MIPRPEIVALPREHPHEPLAQVYLNLEESGLLCHFMMQHDRFRHLMMGARPHHTTEAKMFERQKTLYERIALANDMLMGKV